MTFQWIMVLSFIKPMCGGKRDGWGAPGKLLSGKTNNKGSMSNGELK